MDFIERGLHTSPGDGNGVTELLIVTAIAAIIVSAVVTWGRGYFPRNFIEFLEQLGKRENSDRFDNWI